MSIVLLRSSRIKTDERFKELNLWRRRYFIYTNQLYPLPPFNHRYVPLWIREIAEKLKLWKALDYNEIGTIS